MKTAELRAREHPSVASGNASLLTKSYVSGGYVYLRFAVNEVYRDFFYDWVTGELKVATPTPPASSAAPAAPETAQIRKAD